MNRLIENRLLEDTVYVSESGQRLYVESVIGAPEDEFYLVNTVPAEDKDDMDAIGDELDSAQWLDMVNRLGFKPESIENEDRLDSIRSMFKKSL